MSRIVAIVFAALTTLAFSPLASLAAGPDSPEPPPLDPSGIGEAAGTVATVAEGGVVRVGWSREVPVVVDGFPLHAQESAR